MYKSKAWTVVQLDISAQKMLAKDDLFDWEFIVRHRLLLLANNDADYSMDK